jgi:hypothetical protein
MHPEHTHYLPTYLPSWRRVLEKLTVTQLVKNCSAFYGIGRLITVFIRARHWFLFRARCNRYTTLSWSRIVPPFMESEGWLPCSYEPATGSYSEPDATGTLPTYLPSWGSVFLEKLIITQLVKKLPAFYGTLRYITVFTGARYWSLSWARWIQSTPSHPISLRSILK